MLQVTNVRFAALVDFANSTSATAYLSKIWAENKHRPVGSCIDELPNAYLGCRLVVRREGLHLEVDFESLDCVQPPIPLARGIRAQEFFLTFDVDVSFKPCSVTETNGVSKMLRPHKNGTRILVSGYQFNPVLKAAKRIVTKTPIAT